MGPKVTHSLFDRHIEDNIKFMMYMFIMKLIGDNIYKKHRGQDKWVI